MSAPRLGWFCAMFGALTHWLVAAEPALIENGQPRAEIVVAEKPARMTTLAARELATYLEKITGAKLETVTRPTPGKLHLFVGRSTHTDALALSTAGLENGAFRMASGPNWLALLGPDEDFVPIEPYGRNRTSAETARVNAAFDKITGDTFWNNCRELYMFHYPELGVWAFDDRGTLNAVYEFLRGLGVRWYAPGELGEVVPHAATVPLPRVNQTIRPDFALRRVSYYTENIGLGDVALWNLRLGLNPAHKLIGVTQPGHGIKFVLWRAEMKQAHPEMYALIKGKRDTTHKGTGAPCLTSKLLFAEQLKYARAMFDHFQQPMISIDMVDGYGSENCEDEACRRQFTPDRGWRGSMSDYVWGYENRIAEELYRTHPDRMVSGLAYSAYQEPPEKLEKMSPNLAIIECRTRSHFWDEDDLRHHRAVREAWLKKLPSGKYFTWDYYLSAVPENVGRPVFFPKLIASDLRELKGVSLGDTIEVYLHQPGVEAKLGYDALATEHLNLYVTSRLWWNAGQDLGALLDDYYANYYGPARAEMKAFIEYAERNWMHMQQDPARIAEAFALLAKAQAAVDAKSAFGRRIEKIAALMKPLHALQHQLQRKHETTQSFRILETDQIGGKPMRQKPLDGQLDPAFWLPVRVGSLSSLRPGARVQAPSTVQIYREGETLFFGIRCDEPDMAGLKIGTRESGDPKILDGDYVTLLFETPSRSFYEIAVNPAGAVLERDHGEAPSATWKSGAHAAVHRGPNFWSIELRLPLAGEGARLLDPTTGIDGAQPKDLFPWYFNVGRLRVRGAEVERTALGPIARDDFYAPEKFVRLWGK